MFDYQRMKGSFATLLTPFLAGNEVDFEELRKETEFLCSSAITGLFPLATFSEFPFLQLETKREYLRLVAAVNAGRKVLLAGCCGVNETETLALMAMAAEYGYDAAVVCPPYYYTYNGDELVRYYNRVAANPYGMKVILYNIPCFTSEVPVPTVERLLDNPNIIGIKDSSGNVRRMANVVDLKRRRGREFIVYCGSDDILLPALIAGCEGSLSGMSCLLPETVTALYRHVYAGNWQEAQRVQMDFVDVVEKAETVSFPVGYKLIAKLRGMNLGVQHQLPDEAAVERLRTWMAPRVEALLQTYGGKDAVL